MNREAGSEQDPPAAGGHRIDASVVDQAVAWFVLLRSGHASAEDHAAAERWRRAHPDHGVVWERLQTMHESIHGVTETLSPSLVRNSLRGRDGVSRSRRRALRTLALLGAVGMGAWMTRGHLPGKHHLADYRTAVGERRAVLLDNGTRLLLNTATAVDVHEDAYHRAIHLHGGEIQVTTGHDPAGRPMTVTTADGAVNPVGTRFSVRRYRDERQTTVRVLSGQVRATPLGSGDGLSLPAGRQTRFTRHAVDPPVPLDDAAVSWTSGMLTAERTRLENFVRELARHRHGVTRCDPSVAGLKLTGTYPLDDTDRVLTALERTLPVRIRRFSRFWVDVLPAGEGDGA